MILIKKRIIEAVSILSILTLKMETASIIFSGSQTVFSNTEQIKDIF